jgi:hypothetical protein
MKINLSKNKDLSIINLSNNKFTEIDFSNNKELREILLDNNELKNINLSNNINLKDLDLSSNQFKIDLSKKNKDLFFNSKFKHHSGVLDLSNNLNLKRLNLRNNPPLIIEYKNKNQKDNIDINCENTNIENEVFKEQIRKMNL